MGRSQKETKGCDIMCYQCSEKGCRCLCVFIDASTSYTIYTPNQRVCEFCGHNRNYRADSIIQMGSNITTDAGSNGVQYVTQKGGF